MGKLLHLPNHEPSCVNADSPVVFVSWNDCQQFLEKLNALPAVAESGLVFRLPSKSEWQYACRAGAMEEYCLLADGTEITRETLGEVAWYKDNSGNNLHPVGQKTPNAFGLYDMLGNVWEWTQSGHGDNHITLGGSYSNVCQPGVFDELADADLLVGFRLWAEYRESAEIFSIGEGRSLR